MAYSVSVHSKPPPVPVRGRENKPQTDTHTNKHRHLLQDVRMDGAWLHKELGLKGGSRCL